jgi:alpha-tubulin suppressor-like RCC1 family protein
MDNLELETIPIKINLKNIWKINLFLYLVDQVIQLESMVFLLFLISFFSKNKYLVFFTENGELFSWGRNQYGQLGLGDLIDRNKSSKILELNNETIISISCGEFHNAVITGK